jgi:hypothetical protein
LPKAVLAPVAGRLRRLIVPMAIVVCLASLLVITFYSLNMMARQHVITAITSAAASGNINQLSELTDWSALREWLKRDLHTRTQTIMAKSSGHGLSLEEVDNIVDYYVQPMNIPMLLYYHNQMAPDIKPEEFVREVKFLDVGKMEVTLGFPPKRSKPWIKGLEPVRAVFQLEGMAWKMKELHAPFYLVPTAAPSVDPKTGAVKPAAKKAAKPIPNGMAPSPTEPSLRIEMPAAPSE